LAERGGKIEIVFKCPRCGELCEHWARAVPPGEAREEEFLGMAGRAASLRLRWAEPAGKLFLERDAGGGWHVSLNHYKCGYDGPLALDSRA